MADRFAAPEFGTPAYEWWARGAHAEHDLTVAGMTYESRQLYDCVQTLAQRGDSRDDIIRWMAHVFTCEWPLRRRLRLAWELVSKP